MTAPLEASALLHDYGDGPVLDIPRLHLDEGRVHLAGPNGSGKTTLLRILSTLLEPTRGDARVDGCSIRQEPRQARRRLGFAGHDPILHTSLETRDTLALHADLHSVDASVDEALDAWGLAPLAGTPVAQLSRGQARRLDLARALVHEPPVLLLDEPATGLDERARELLDERLHDASPRLVLIAAPGDPGLPADRRIRLEQGRLEEAPA